MKKQILLLDVKPFQFDMLCIECFDRADIEKQFMNMCEKIP